jgi:hypothetical protein
MQSDNDNHAVRTYATVAPACHCTEGGVKMSGGTLLGWLKVAKVRRHAVVQSHERSIALPCLSDCQQVVSASCHLHLTSLFTNGCFVACGRTTRPPPDVCQPAPAPPPPQPEPKRAKKAAKPTHVDSRVATATEPQVCVCVCVTVGVVCWLCV